MSGEWGGVLLSGGEWRLRTGRGVWPVDCGCGRDSRGMSRSELCGFDLSVYGTM